MNLQANRRLIGVLVLIASSLTAVAVPFLYHAPINANTANNGNGSGNTNNNTNPTSPTSTNNPSGTGSSNGKNSDDKDDTHTPKNHVSRGQGQGHAYAKGHSKSGDRDRDPPHGKPPGLGVSSHGQGSNHRTTSGPSSHPGRQNGRSGLHFAFAFSERGRSSLR